MANRVLPDKSPTWLKALGPGLIMAGAAIGVSHLVQATRAGAEYGLIMFVPILLACIFKYPFLEYGPRYAAATGESLLDGYKRLGTWALVIFGFITAGTMFAITASVTAVTAGIAGHLVGVTPDLTIWSAVILGGCLVLLLLGRYRLLDRTMKVIMAILAICTFAAMIAALFFFAPAETAEVIDAPALFSAGSLVFLLALMGWMPIPIDVAVWHSLWTLERQRETGHAPSTRDAITDFNIGYVVSFGMATAFLGLGAFVMHGSATRFPAEAVPFAAQLIELYTQTLGAWSGPLIAVAALVTMFSTTLAVTDAYPRVLERFVELISPKGGERHAAPRRNSRTLYLTFLFAAPIGALIVIQFFARNLTTLVDVATTLSFLSAPVLGYMNYRLVTSSHMPKGDRPNRWLRWLSWAGLAFLIAFCVAFMVVQLPR